MTCLISVGKSGKYCCIEAARTPGDLQHMDLNKGALLVKAANLPPTPILCLVGKEWVDSGQVTSACTVLCKPGCYKIDIDCADYDGVVAPVENPVELCFECDPDFDKVAWAIESMQSTVMIEGDVMVDFTELEAKLCAVLGPVEGPNVFTCIKELKEFLICEPEEDKGVLTSFSGLRAA